jgi:hypothetical protein
MASTAFTTFTKFDPRAFLENQAQGDTPAKPAKPVKAVEPECAGLATLATLAGGQSEAENLAPTPDTWADAQEERAAIVEYDGGVPRPWAEALARLDPARGRRPTYRRGAGCSS